MPWGTSSRRCSSAFSRMSSAQIGHRVSREVLRPFRQVADQQLLEFLHAVSLGGADGHDVIIPRRLIALHQRQQGFLGQQVDLVEHQRLFHLVAAHVLHDLVIVLAHGGGVHHDDQRVNALQRVLGGLHHVFAQTGAGRVQAGGVQKDNLRVLLRIDAHDAVAGGLGPVGDDGHFFAHHGVHQSAFAHVGATHNGDKTRMLHNNSFYP